MDRAKSVVAKLVRDIDIILIVYSIKRWNKLPLKYSKIFYAVVLSPIMLANALYYHDLIAYRYRKFLMGFAYTEVKMVPTDSHVGCKTHQDLTTKEKLTSCFDLFLREWPNTVKRVLKLYSRFYLLQLIIVTILTKKFQLSSVKNAAMNTLWSCLFLGGQTLTVRFELCFAEKVLGWKLTWAKIYALMFLNSFAIFFERADRVGQINNLVIAHIFIGLLKKFKLLGLHISLPILLATLLKDRSVKPVTLAIAMASTIVFD